MSDVLAGPAVPRAENAGPLILSGLTAAAVAVPVVLLASLPGLVFAAGFDHLAYGLAVLAGVVLAGLLIAPRVRRAGGETITSALERRFGTATAWSAGLVVVLAALPLLAAEFTLVAALAETGFALHHFAALALAFALSAAAAAALRDGGFRWLSRAAYAALAASLLVPLALLAFKTHGAGVPSLAVPETLTAVGALEEKLVEGGLVDFDTFSVHVTPFARLAGLDLVALVVSVSLGIAVLPPLVSALAADRRPAAIRLAGAWTALFVMGLLLAVPALAAYAKLAIYGAIADATPLASLPGWLEAPLRADLAQVHGTSLALLDQVAAAVSAGARDAATIADRLALHATAMEERWRALAPETQDALLAAARAVTAGEATLWDAYLTTVLPAAASAVGNEAAALTQAALVIEPAGLLVALPALSGIPAWGAGPWIAAVVFAALVAVAAQIRGLLALSRNGADATPEAPRWRALALVLIAVALAAATAALRPHELTDIAVASLSLAAAGLFPVLALGLVWRRATAAGAVMAILLGAGVTLYYDIGTQVFPAAFYRTWAPLSNAGESAIEEFAALETEIGEAADDEAKATAAAALETLARGTATRAGLANWFGIESTSAAVFAVPLGLLVLVLVSLVTPRPYDRKRR
jgi:cation/acetate symporter